MLERIVVLIAYMQGTDKDVSITASGGTKAKTPIMIAPTDDTRLIGYTYRPCKIVVPKRMLIWSF